MKNFKRAMFIYMGLIMGLVFSACSDGGSGGRIVPPPTPDGNAATSASDATRAFGGTAVCAGQVIDAVTRQGIVGAKVEVFAAYLPSGPTQSQKQSDNATRPVVTNDDIVSKTFPNKFATKKQNEVDFDEVLITQVEVNPNNKNKVEPDKHTPPVIGGDATNIVEERKPVIVATKTVKDNPSTAINEAGIFVASGQSGLPTSSQLRVLVSHPGYATIEYDCNTPHPDGGAAVTADMQYLELPPAIDQNIVVNNNEVPMSFCTVFAKIQGVPREGEQEVVAKTDALGQAKLTGISQIHPYFLYVSPCDTDGNGTLDSPLYDEEILPYMNTGDEAHYINVALSATDDEFKPIGTNGVLFAGKTLFDDKKNHLMKKALVDGVAMKNLGKPGQINETVQDVLVIKDQKIEFMFSHPIASVSHDVRLSFIDDLVDDENDEGEINKNYGKTRYIDLICTTEDFGVSLVCVPELELKHMETYTLHGTISANLPTGTKNPIAAKMYDLKQLPQIHFSKADAIAFSVDNYNNNIPKAGAGDDAVGAGAFLKFSELVYGKAYITKYEFEDDSDLENESGRESVDLQCIVPLEGGEVIFEHHHNCDATDCVDTKSSFYRVAISHCLSATDGSGKPVAITDNNKVTVEIEAYNAFGPLIHTEPESKRIK